MKNMLRKRVGKVDGGRQKMTTWWFVSLKYGRIIEQNTIIRLENSVWLIG